MRRQLLLRLIPLHQVCQAVLLVLSSLTFLRAQSGNWQVLEVGENGAALCPNNAPVSAVVITGGPWEQDRSWQFLCQTSQDNHTRYVDGQWEKEHNVLRQTLFLKCPRNKFISGVYTNYSERFLDRIWWLHCSGVDHTLVLTNCSWTQGSYTDEAISFSLPSHLAVFTAMYSTYNYATNDREWFFQLCILQDLCSPGARSSTPSGGSIIEVNSSLQIHCPLGGYLNGPMRISCPLHSNTTFPTCHLCPSIKFCEEVSCTSPDSSVCTKCMAYHPKLNLPIVPNKRRRKCRVPPVISLGPDVVTFVEGDDVILPCIARGIPKPKIQWLYDGEPWMNGSTGSITITNVSEASAGIYTCVATNVVGNDSIDLTLINLLPPAVITPLSRHHSATVGDEAVLFCQAEGFETITWVNCSDHGRMVTSNHSRVTFHNSSQVLRIYPVIHEDAGVFGCTVSNRVGAVHVNIVLHTIDIGQLMELIGSGSGTGTIAQATPPHIVNWTDVYTTVVGSSVVMNCEAVGNPVPVVYWQREAHVLSSGRRMVRLILEGVTANTAGNYTCLASSMYQVYSVVEQTTLLIINVQTPTEPLLTSTDLLLPSIVYSASSQEPITSRTPLPLTSPLPTDPSAGCRSICLLPLIPLTAATVAVFFTLLYSR